MSQERRERLAQALSDELRGLEDAQIKRIGRIFDAALKATIERVYALLDGIEAQPWYDPKTTPGAFQGSTPDGPVPIEPVQKNQAKLYLEGQLLQDLRRALDQMQLTPQQLQRLDRELATLFNRAQDLGTEYATQLQREELRPALSAANRPPEPDPVLSQWPDREYQEGQRFTRLFDYAGAVAAAERDFKSLSENYRQQRDLATNDHVRRAKDYYFKWWRHWGDTVSFLTGRQMASGPDPRTLKRELQKAIPNVNEAFRNRAETIARTETLLASGEAQERCYRQMNVGFVQYAATADDRTCDFCAPRSGCLYWIGSVKTPIHPNCRCALTPVTLEALVLQNAMADNEKEKWEAEAQAAAAGIERHFKRANGDDAVMRPIGGPGQGRTTRDLPLMERNGLPATQRRKNLPVRDEKNQGSQPWPAGDPVWDPRRGWLDPNAKQAYEAVMREVEQL
jgi:SPP1 gp7 family putative phage head morphogenesis protein